MEASRHFGKLGIGGRSQGPSSRKNAILVAVLSAVLAAALIYLFVTHYKKNATPQVVTAPPATVWVATHAILQGTPESEVAAQGYFKPTQVAATSVMAGAITDPALVAGEVAQSTIAAGQQITATDFAKGPVLASALKGNQRAVAFSFDTEHGITSWLAVGDTVDVMLLHKNKSELIDQNVTVLENEGGLVVLKLTDKQALLLTGFTQQGSLWLSLRPALKASNSIRIYSQGA
jgi:Flp pilus assembly protein CpaB